MDGVDRDRVAVLICRARRGRLAVEQTLVVGRVVLLVEAGGETKVGQLDVAVLVDEDVVGLDVAARSASSHPHDAPMDEAELVDRLERQDALGDVEARDVLGERVVLDQHRHQVAAGQELH